MIGRALRAAALGAGAAALWAGAALAQAPVADELAAAAAQLYGIGDYAGAASAYGEAVSMGARDAAVYHNLGASLLAAERPVPAVLAFRRSLALDPAHPGSRAGLDAARAALDVPEPPPGPVAERAAAAIVSVVPAGPLAAAAIASAALCAVGWAAFRLVRRGARRRATLAAAAALAIFSALAAATVAIESGRDAADAVALRDVPLRSGPGGGYVRVETAPAGTEVEVVDERGEWVRLRLPPDGQGAGGEGWAEAGSIERVLPRASTGRPAP